MRAVLLLMLAGCNDNSLSVRNTAPDAEITSHNDLDTVDQDVPVLFRGRVSDAEQDESLLGITWYLGDAPITGCIEVDEDGVTTCEMILGPGDIDITLEVTDGIANDSDIITVTPVPLNEPPTCLFTSPLPGTSFGPAEVIELVGQVDDERTPPEELDVQFASDWDGPLGSSTPSASGRVVLAAQDLSARQHEITLIATDPRASAAWPAC